MTAAPEPIPSTPEAAAEAFRCGALACTLSGQACGRRHAQTMARGGAERWSHAGNGGRRDACVRCPAGAARVELLGIDAGRKWAPPVKSARPSYLSLPPPPKGWHE
jgi:hypothetical protein